MQATPPEVAHDKPVKPKKKKKAEPAPRKDGRRCPTCHQPWPEEKVPALQLPSPPPPPAITPPEWSHPCIAPFLLAPVKQYSTVLKFCSGRNAANPTRFRSLLPAHNQPVQRVADNTDDDNCIFYDGM